MPVNAQNHLGVFPMSIWFLNKTAQDVTVKLSTTSSNCKLPSLITVLAGKKINIGGCDVVFKMGYSSFSENTVSTAEVIVSSPSLDSAVKLVAKVPGCWGTGHPSFSYSVKGLNLSVKTEGKTTQPYAEAHWNKQGANLLEYVPFFNVYVIAE